MWNWEDIGIGWKAALNQMWEGYRTGCSPIGASVCDSAGQVVAVGRNSINDPRSGMPIVSHQLSHAEINAILQLSENDHPDIRSYTLYATLEPCPLCFGAIVMGSIRRFAYAARDVHGGAVALNESIPYIMNKGIAVQGPMPELEAIVYAVKTCFALEHSHQGALRDFRQACPQGYAAGERLHAGGTLHPLREAEDFAPAYAAILKALEEGA